MSDTAVNEQGSALLPAFSEAIQEVFQTMVFLSVVPGEPGNKERGLPKGSISGTVSISGDEVCGNVSLIFEMEFARIVFRSMMGMEQDAEVNMEEISDVIGEIANMVAGGAKSRISSSGIHFKIGLPSVVIGEGHSIEPPKDVQTMIQSFTTDFGVFYLELSC